MFTIEQLMCMGAGIYLLFSIGYILGYLHR